jgi:hypothetical protein
LGLKVGEVSLVDSPANEKEFLVTKNLEENVMGEKQSNAAERVEIEQAAGDSDVTSVLKHVTAIVENIAKAVTSGNTASAPAIAAATETETETDETDEADVEKSSFSAMMKAAGVKMTPEMMAKLKAAGFDPSQKFPTAKPPTSGTTKAATPAAATDEAFAETVLTIEGLSSMITKAKKFTPGRIEKLRGAVDALKGLLEEISEVPQASMPGVSTPSGTTFGPSGVKSLADGNNVDTSKSTNPGMTDVLKAINGLAEVVKNLGGEVESIKKARPASNSVEEGGTDKPVQKSNFWGGVL